jgi:hypothetical protein
MKRGDVGKVCNVDERGKRQCNFKDTVQRSIQTQGMLTFRNRAS